PSVATLRSGALSGMQLGRSLVGGRLMGFAIILVPGGNDTTPLSALPSLALHGAVAELSMLGVQVSLAMIAKQWKQRNLRAATAAQRAKRPLADRAAPRPNSYAERGQARPLVSAPYQRSACLPTNKPNIDMRPIASAYQIATNSGESFV